MKMRKWLKEVRKSRHMTQQQVADKIGISRCYYTQLETNSKKGLRPRVAIRLSKVLGFEWQEFYEADAAE
jgi:transcriptional regulator with XRE-family HTH domain